MKTVGMGVEKKSGKSGSADARLKKENKELQNKVNCLTAENAELKARITGLTAENAELGMTASEKKPD